MAASRKLSYKQPSSYIRSRLASPNPCHSDCEVGDIWHAGARCVDDLCKYPPHSARRPLRHHDRHAETRARRGDAAPRHLDRRADPVLLRHGYHRSELERSGGPPLEAGEQLCFGLAPEQLLVKGDDRICSRLLGSVEPIEHTGEITKAGPRPARRPQSGGARHRSTGPTPAAP